MLLHHTEYYPSLRNMCFKYIKMFGGSVVVESTYEQTYSTFP